MKNSDLRIRRCKSDAKTGPGRKPETGNNQRPWKRRSAPLPELQHTVRGIKYGLPFPSLYLANDHTPALSRKAAEKNADLYTQRKNTQLWSSLHLLCKLRSNRITIVAPEILALGFAVNAR